MIHMNTEEIQDHIRKLMGEFDKRASASNTTLEDAVTKCCLIVERDAKIGAPVDTGNLRRSITHVVEADENSATGTVGTNVEYAAFQEFGTSRMRAHPYLTPAFEKNRMRCTKIITTAVKNAVQNRVQGDSDA